MSILIITIITLSTILTILFSTILKDKVKPGGLIANAFQVGSVDDTKSTCSCICLDDLF